MNEGDDCLMIFPNGTSTFVPSRGCFIVNLSKGYIMFLMIENEVRDNGQFKECIEKIHQKKAMLLESVNFMKTLENQWLCLELFYSHDGAAQCNCDTCCQFAITGNESAHQKLNNVDAKVKEGQPRWKPEKHIYELLDILQSSPEQKRLSTNMKIGKNIVSKGRTVHSSRAPSINPAKAFKSSNCQTKHLIITNHELNLLLGNIVKKINGIT